MLAVAKIYDKKLLISLKYYWHKKQQETYNYT